MTSATTPAATTIPAGTTTTVAGRRSDPHPQSDHDTDEAVEPIRLRVVGGGEIAVALAQLASVLRWDCTICERLDDADDLRGTHALVVLSHDLEVAGTALCRGLAGPLDYVGGLGGHTTQRLRRDWLRSRRVDPQRIDRIHGPAGLDIGASAPVEIALAIVAEIVAVRHGAAGGPLS
ncbi:xanthine dehydrogenase accessory factor [Friedmanniella endophytica]|uniref:Xanthine dehydrogenase accessory factor n=1 Tax=Microlunatus kandeliicorticis TaxID=1759536 RepID=A0A7W3P4E1_9ACTN|nr:XdhC family protein [Microlunatus kandeliicorticis]MBA8792777.1 xanthine dehydrogenase accessory factor [Microlunatus kandeliicorticis]